MRCAPTLLALATLVTVTGCQDRPAPPATPPAPTATPGTPEFDQQRMAWFRDARFGMFIHWGVYAVPAGTYQGKRIHGIGEWILNNGQIPIAEYKTYAPGFTAAKYDPEAWAALAKRAGMKYVVITSKHHDGFALFDSAVSDWDAVQAGGAKRDLLAPLEKAVRGQGLRFGLYYSQAQDWVHPGGGAYKKKWDPAQEGDFDRYLDQIAIPQTAEILEKFRPDLLWWDTPANMNPERAARFAPVLAKYPALVMNDRLGGGVKGDCNTPEQHIPPRGFPGRDFEVCMTMNDTWGFKSYDDKWKPTRQLLEHLSDIASKGGNFLLNVGPTAEGEIPAASIERLEAMGRWMDVNGEAIHGTQASPFAKRLPWGRVTRKATSDGGEILYLHVWHWPSDGRLILPKGGQPGATARLLANRSPVSVAQDGERLVLTLPTAKPDPIIGVVALHLAKPVVDTTEPLATPGADGSVVLPVLEADNHGHYSGMMAVQGSGDDLHFGPWTDTNWWLEYRFQAPKAQTWLVKADVAAAEATTINLQVGKTVVAAPVAPTGGAETFTTVELGRITLSAGEAVFGLKAEKKGWKPLRVRTVTLVPAP